MLHRSRSRESVKEIGNSITYLVTYAIFPIKFLNNFICVFVSRILWISFILYIKMASLTSNLTSIKIRGVHKAKHEIDLATTTLGDIKTWIKTKVEDNDLMLKLFVKGKTFEGSETDTMLASDAGIKKGSVVKALRSTAVAVQNKAKQMSAEPGAKTVDAGPRQRCKGGCGFWGAVASDWYCSSCWKTKSGVEQPPHWEHNDGGWTKFPKQVSSQLEAARKVQKTNLMSYGTSGHPQRLDLRKLTMTPTRGPRQGRAIPLRRVPPTHPGTWLTEKEFKAQQVGVDEKKKVADIQAEAAKKKEERVKRLESMTKCCLDTCKKKLRMTDTPCRCELRFCLKHRLPEKHECQFDYTKRANDNLAERLGDGGGNFDQLRTGSRDRI